MGDEIAQLFIFNPCGIEMGDEIAQLFIFNPCGIEMGDEIAQLFIFNPCGIEMGDEIAQLFIFNPCGIEMGDEIAQLQNPCGIETSAVTVLAGRIPGKACSFAKMRPVQSGGIGGMAQTLSCPNRRVLRNSILPHHSVRVRPCLSVSVHPML
jgi:hypothetical protein